MRCGRLLGTKATPAGSGMPLITTPGKSWPTSLGAAQRSADHTTTQEKACTSSQPAVTMSVSALLKLAQWCQCRLDDPSGDSVCTSPTTVPPACVPQPRPSPEPSGGTVASALGDASSRDAAASESNPGACHRPTQSSSHAGGGR